MKKTIKEDISVNITANGREDVECLLKKLAGIEATVDVAPAATPAPAPTAQTVEFEDVEEVDEGEEDRKFNNSPHEKTFGLDAQVNQGYDLNRPKQQFRKEYPGDNIMTANESAELDEKWAHKAKINPAEKGKHTEKSVAELRKQLAGAKKRGDTSAMRELNFAIRAKTGWGKVSKEGVNESSVEEMRVDEKWGVKTTPPASEKGKHTNKTVAELRKQLANAKKRGDTSAMRELNFAIRAKTGWGKVKKEGVDEAIEINEKWEGEHKLNPKKIGMFKGKNKSELQAEYNKLKKSGPHKKGSPAFTKMKELMFAIRAKSGWGKTESKLPIGKAPVIEAALNESVQKLEETLWRKYILEQIDQISEAPTDPEEKKFRCGELSKLKNDPKAMQDPATRNAVIRKWKELGCGF